MMGINIITKKESEERFEPRLKKAKRGSNHAYVRSNFAPARRLTTEPKAVHGLLGVRGTCPGIICSLERVLTCGLRACAGGVKSDAVLRSISVAREAHQKYDGSDLERPPTAVNRATRWANVGGK